MEVETYPYDDLEDVINAEGTILVMDHIHDPQNFGTLLRAVGRLAEAQQCYEQALRLEPDDILAKANLGLLCMERGELVQARDLLLDAALHQPGDLSLRINAALVSHECGDTLAV